MFEINMFGKTYKSLLVPFTDAFLADSSDSAEDDGTSSALSSSGSGMAYMLQLNAKIKATTMAQHNFDSIFTKYFSQNSNNRNVLITIDFRLLFDFVFIFLLVKVEQSKVTLDSLLFKMFLFSFTVAFKWRC